MYEGHSADKYPNSCQTATLTLDTEGGSFRRTCGFARGPGAATGSTMTVLYSGSAGRLTWRFETAAAKPTAPNPYDPWNPRRDTFVGRKEILRRLEAALSENRSFSIVADGAWGIDAARRLCRRAKEFGRVAVLLSGEGPEGRSISSFVQKITGLAAPRPTRMPPPTSSAYGRRPLPNQVGRR